MPLRTGLWSPQNTLVIGQKQTLLSYDKFVCGLDWANCYMEGMQHKPSRAYDSTLQGASAVQLLIENGADENGEQNLLAPDFIHDDDDVGAEPQDVDKTDVPISTFVIYSPKSPHGLQNHGPLAVQPEEFKILETDTPDTGRPSSVYTPDHAILWVEAHYDDPLLQTMRTRGLGGPIAGMLSPDAPTLVIFGSILDGWAQKAAKLLASLSGFIVMIRPIPDDPVKKWNAERLYPEDADVADPAGDFQNIMREEASHYGDDSDNSEDEDSTTTSDEESVSDGDSNGDSNGDAVLRLRGGAGHSEKYIPENGPVHNMDIHLAFHQRQVASCHAQPDLNNHVVNEVSILCKIQFTVQSKYTDDKFNGYRPQAVSWTRLSVFPSSRALQVLCDRSYCSIGFLVHEGKYIEDCMGLDCEGYTLPKHTTKTVKTKTRGFTGTASIMGGMNPTGGAKLALNKTNSDGTEKQNDRVTPTWVVGYENGGKWSRDGQSYWGQNVSFYQPEGPTAHDMRVEYSMGINVGDQENPENTQLPRISFVTRNQIILWVPDKSLKARGYGILVFTSSYIPEIETKTALYMVENQKVDLIGNSLFGTFYVAAGSNVSNCIKDVPEPDKAAPTYPALLALSVAVPPSDEKPNLFRQMANKLAVLSQRKTEDTSDSRISALPLYDFKARGWDATTEEWRMPVYPRLDRALRRAEDQTVDVYDLKRVAENLAKVKGKQRDTGPVVLVVEPAKAEVHGEVDTVRT
ncbi:hypothetical protein B0H19DRAFT_1285671 [Mycena capillaripes]|nr:hypothetical protein B0H19DRAFT_1285671 [Mycena capillaripes]